MRLLPWIERTLRPRLLVVKSEELHASAVRWQHQQQQERQAQQQGPQRGRREQTQPQEPRQEEQQAACPASSSTDDALPAGPTTLPADSFRVRGGGALAACSAAAPQVVAEAGLVPQPAAWWRSLHEECGVQAIASSSSVPQSVVQPWYRAAHEGGWTRNPLRLPQRFNAAGVQLCRPHNYQQCLKPDACPFDHAHCHYCGGLGHRGRECPVALAALNVGVDPH